MSAQSATPVSSQAGPAGGVLSGLHRTSPTINRLFAAAVGAAGFALGVIATVLSLR